MCSLLSFCSRNCRRVGCVAKEVRMIILRKHVGNLTKITLERFVARAQRAARLAGSINVVVTSSAEMRALNRRFRGKDQATDVLSFPAAADAAADTVGEIAISGEIAAQNARALGHTAAEEIKILVLHGILHLRGYDHEHDGGEMARHESRLRALLRLPVGLIERAAGSGENWSGKKKSGEGKRRGEKNSTAAAPSQRATAGRGKTSELGTNGKGTSAASGTTSIAASSRWGTASPRKDFFRNLPAARAGRKRSR